MYKMSVFVMHVNQREALSRLLQKVQLKV